MDQKMRYYFNLHFIILRLKPRRTEDEKADYRDLHFIILRLKL